MHFQQLVVSLINTQQLTVLLSTAVLYHIKLLVHCIALLCLKQWVLVLDLVSLYCVVYVFQLYLPCILLHRVGLLETVGCSPQGASLTP